MVDWLDTKEADAFRVFGMKPFFGPESNGAGGAVKSHTEI